MMYYFIFTVKRLEVRVIHLFLLLDQFTDALILQHFLTQTQVKPNQLHLLFSGMSFPLLQISNMYLHCTSSLIGLLDCLSFVIDNSA